MPFFYAVANGRVPGIYHTWEECNKQVFKFGSAKHKKFKTREEAERFIIENKPNIKSNISESIISKSINQATTSSSRSSPRTPSLIRPAIFAFEKRPSIRPASSLESVISLDKVIHKSPIAGFLRKKSLLFQANEDTTIIISDDEQISSPKSNQLENESVILLDEDSSQLSVIDIKKNKQSNKTAIRTPVRATNRTSLRLSRSNKINSIRKANLQINDENQSRNKLIKNQQEAANGNQSLIKANRGHCVVFTDGACSRNGSLDAKAGIGVWWNKDDPRNLSEPLDGRATNNRAEIWAAIRAINQAAEQGYDSITVCSDRFV